MHQETGSKNSAVNYYYCSKNIFFPEESIIAAIYEYSKSHNQIYIHNLYNFLRRKFNVSSFNKNKLLKFLRKHFSVQGVRVIINDTLLKEVENNTTDIIKTIYYIYNSINIFGFDLVEEILDKGIYNFTYYLNLIFGYNNRHYVNENFESALKSNFTVLKRYFQKGELNLDLNYSDFELWFQKNKNEYLADIKKDNIYNYIKSLLTKISIKNYKSKLIFITNNEELSIILEKYNIQTTEDLISKFNYNLFLEINDLYDFCKVLKFLETDISSYIKNTFKKIISKNIRDYNILKLRVENYTLEQIGKRFNITRERVRQIVSKSIKIFKKTFQTSKLLNLIKALSKSNHVVSIQEIKRIFKEETNTFIFILRSSSLIGFKYIKELGCVNISKFNWPKNIRDFTFELPSIILKKDLRKRIYDFIEGFNEDIREVYSLYTNQFINLCYKKIGSIYTKEKLTLTQKYKFILFKYFPKGIYIYKNEEIQKFINYYIKEYSDTSILVKNLRSIQGIFSRFCCLIDKGKYNSEDKMPKINKEILSQIESFIDEIGGIAFYDSIFSNFKKSLKENNVKNKYLLQGLLKKEFGEKYFYFKDYISKFQDVSFRQIVTDYANSFSKKFSTRDIKKHFPYIKSYLIENALIYNPNIINMTNKNWIIANKIACSEKEKTLLETKLTELIIKFDFASAQKIYEEVRFHIYEFLQNNDIDNRHALFNVLKYLYKDKFNFNYPVLTRIGVEAKNIVDVVKEFIFKYDEILILDIKHFCENFGFYTGMTELLKGISQDYLRINEEKLAKIDLVGLNDNHIREIKRLLLVYLYKKKGRNLNLINYKIFPVLNYKWNKYLLASLIESKIKELKVIPKSPTVLNTDYIVVKSDLNIKNYEEYLEYVKGV
ncbi:MAG: sigma factor-like helix-turn-helix DNA-binding protein [Bacilli bacterium]